MSSDRQSVPVSLPPELVDRLDEPIVSTDTLFPEIEHIDPRDLE